MSTFLFNPVVLVAEDEPDLRELLQTILVRNDFDVLVAKNGQEALQLYRERSAAIDIVLMDVQMPQLDGISALKAMQAINPNVVCCFMTGSCDSDAEHAPCENGATFVLQKPFSLVEVPKLLRRILNRQPSRLINSSMVTSNP